MDSNFPIQNMSIIDQYQKVFKEPLSINDFEIIKSLGKRKFVEVYQVKYKNNQMIYALKKIDHNYFKGENHQESVNEINYLREKTILYDLTNRNYPNSGKLYTDFEDDEYRYLVLEYCEGTKLKDLKANYNQNGYIPEKDIINILTKLLKALEFLHETCKIINRNIKPKNIMIDKNDNIKLLDFGLSAYLKDPNPRLVSRKSFKGTIEFLPDEIISASKPLNYDYKIDIFSLGYTIYSLMNPSNNDSINLPTMTKKMNDKYEREKNSMQSLMNNYYSYQLIQFIESLYNSDPAKRPTAREALVQLGNLQSYTATDYEKTTNIINDINPFHQPINNNIEQGNSSESGQIKINSNQDNLIKYINPLKCLLRIFYRINLMLNINSEFFKNNNFPYVYSFYGLLYGMKQLDNGGIDSKAYDKLVYDFISFVMRNNYNIIIGDSDPKNLYYILMSIFLCEFNNYLNNNHQNKFSYDVIQDNFLPMNEQQVINQINDAVFTFSNNGKYFFANKFNYLEFIAKKCGKCNKIFLESKIQMVPSLIFDDPKQPNDFSQLIYDRFLAKYISSNNNFQCQICGLSDIKVREYSCLTLPKYLILDFMDRDVCNINSNQYITISLYNGTKLNYEYVACIYKKPIYNGYDFTTVIKNGNQYEIYPQRSNSDLGKPYFALYETNAIS